jgi:hypothetical protein
MTAQALNKAATTSALPTPSHHFTAASFDAPPSAIAVSGRSFRRAIPLAKRKSPGSAGTWETSSSVTMPGLSDCDLLAAPDIRVTGRNVGGTHGAWLLFSLAAPARGIRRIPVVV